MLSFFCFDSVIELYEAIILFCMYLGYCLIMYNNQSLEAWVKGRKSGKQVAPGPGDENAAAPTAATSATDTPGAAEEGAAPKLGAPSPDGSDPDTKRRASLDPSSPLPRSLTAQHKVRGWGRHPH